ncbi:TPA: DUF551 domain-containing protein [Klebsiella pneumoniae]|nr:DUF551 domain-containing protein [Klebsiella pneumoniae]
MTKSTITRERLEQLANFKGAPVTRQEEQELARMALATMDSEPDCKERKLFCSTDTTRMRKTISVSAGTEDAPLYRHAQPALVIPDEMTAEQAYEIGYYYGDPVNVFARGANWMRQHIIDSTLAAAQHDTPALNSVQSVDSVADRWIPVSERIPDNTEPVLCIEKRADFGTYGQPFVCWHDGGGWVGKTNYRPIVTHWMPLPAAPQEVR